MSRGNFWRLAVEALDRSEGKQACHTGHSILSQPFPQGAIPNQNLVQLRVMLDEVLGVGLGEPADAGVRVAAPKGPNHWGREDHIPPGAETNQEDVPGRNWKKSRAHPFLSRAKRLTL